MASAKVFSKDGSETGSVELSEPVFSADMNAGLVHDVAVALQNARRQGNAETKRRAEVRGGGAKPYRQKGTGNARHGSVREPEMRGGGVVFGPHRRSYRHKVPARMRRKALCCALSDRVREGALCVLESLGCDVPKTRPFVEMLSKVSPEGQKTLFVTAAPDRNALLSSRNVPGVRMTTAEEVNALDVLGASRVVVLKDALTKLEERLK